MLKNTATILDDRDFKVSPGLSLRGDYVIERTVVEG